MQKCVIKNEFYIGDTLTKNFNQNRYPGIKLSVLALYVWEEKNLSKFSVVSLSLPKLGLWLIACVAADILLYLSSLKDISFKDINNY